MKRVCAVLVALAALVSATAAAAPAAPAAQNLDSRERATLLSMREEEKLAHDVYVALAKTSGSSVFIRIAAAETRHGLALERALRSYGVADPTDGFAEGVFPTAAFQRLYDELVARGSASAAAAYGVGVVIEKQDISDLAAAIAQTDEVTLDRIYTNLRRGSLSHLAAFERQGVSAGGAGRQGRHGQR